MARAMFTVPAGATAGGPAPGTLTASASAPTTSSPTDDGGKHPRTMAPKFH